MYFSSTVSLSSNFPDDVYKKFCTYIEKFISGIKNKDFNTYYDSIINFVYLSSIRELPTPMSQKIDECIKIMSDFIDKFPAPIIPPLKRDILLRIDPYLYIFIIYIDYLNRYFYTYAALQGYEPKFVEEERKFIKKLFKRFINSYRKNSIQEQFKIIIQLSKEYEKVITILPGIPYTPPIIYIPHVEGVKAYINSYSHTDLSLKYTNKSIYSLIHNRINK